MAFQQRRKIVKSSCRALFLLIILIYSNVNSSAQNVYYRYSEILQYSVKIQYHNNYYDNQSYYNSYWQLYANALDRRQNAYNAGKAAIQHEIDKISSLELINIQNNNLLISFRNKNLDTIKYLMSVVDLSLAANTEALLSIFSHFYSNTSIKNELSLLQDCNGELMRIRAADPDNYIYSLRYRSIMNTLNYLSTCNLNEISSLSWQFTELEYAEIEKIKTKIKTTPVYYCKYDSNFLRRAPNSSGSIVAKLSQNQQVYFIESVNDLYSKVLYCNQREINDPGVCKLGYVLSSYLSLNQVRKVEPSNQFNLKDSSIRNQGKLIVYSTIPDDGELYIYLHGTFIGIIRNYYPNGSPDCTDTLCISVNRPPGEYVLTATGTNRKWQYNVKIVEKQCTIQKISD